MPSAGPGWNVHTIVQFDFRGQIVFQHRCQDKWRFGGNRFVDTLANEQLCFDLVKDLASKWSGVLWRNEQPTPSEQSVIDSIQGKKAIYKRVGYDERILRFAADRLIGDGSAECERCWHVNKLGDEFVLTLSRLDRPTCHLRKRDDKTWTGRWLEYEQMPIELVFLDS
jgi:hypothetical protein